MTEWVIRPATPADATAVADVLIRTRRANAATIPSTIPPMVHSEAEVRTWVSGVLMTEREVWVVHDDSRVIAVLALDLEWLDQLYVLPEYAGQGVGTALLDLAKALRPDGFGLWAFVSNTGAQRFYERHGLNEVERTDGSGNAEGAPEVHYAWLPG